MKGHIMKKYILAALAALVLSIAIPGVSRVLFGDPSPLCPPFCGEQPPSQGGGGN